MIEHLYFHIPFCAKLCPYCSFYVETSFRHKTKAFLDALCTDLERATGEHPARPRTIYFGGGTPTSLSLNELEYIFRRIRETLDTSAVEEWSIEINPATVSPAKAKLLLEFGINRVSMGVQSWDDGVLRTLGRNHTREKAEQTFHVLRDAGFKNIGLDLMFAVPFQTPEQWQTTLDHSIAIQPEHISSYCLTYEEDTDFFTKLGAGTFSQDSDREREMFERCMDSLTAAGYRQYEISNYSLPGFESAHNGAYWTGADFLGIGPSAFSTVRGRRWQQIPDVAEYTRRMAAGESAVSFEEELSPEKKQGETLGLQMRTANGVSLENLHPWQPHIAEFMELGLISEHEGRARLTRRGKLLADSVAELFV